MIHAGTVRPIVESRLWVQYLLGCSWNPRQQSYCVQSSINGGFHKQGAPKKTPIGYDRYSDSQRGARNSGKPPSTANRGPRLFSRTIYSRIQKVVRWA